MDEVSMLGLEGWPNLSPFDDQIFSFYNVDTLPSFHVELMIGRKI